MKLPLPLLPAVCACAASPGLLMATDPAPPNLIVIMSDDQGYADVGFHGNSQIPTPNIDRIAKEGVVFTDAYVTFAVCGPSRAGFITGRYPQRFGFERNPAWCPADPTVGLSREEKTIAEILRPAGYKSGVIGKWHLGSHEDLHPLSRGFDEFFGHLGGGHRYFPEELTIKNTLDAKTEPDSYRTWISRGRNPVRTEKYLTEEFSREAVEFVQRHKDGPFFLFLAYNAPHAPLQAPAKEIEKFNHIPDEKRRIYAAMVSIMDRGIGEVLDELDKQGISDKTLVFFLTDNGGATDANTARNAPLRGKKSTPFEGGIRVPMAARWPGVIPPGLRYSQPVSSMDILGTIAALNNIAPDPNRPWDGVNLLPYLLGQSSGAPHQNICLRSFDTGALALRSGDFKILRTKKDEDLQLFDLGKDISEKQNLAPEKSETVAALHTAYEAWNQTLKEPAFPGLDMREWKQVGE